MKVIACLLVLCFAMCAFAQLPGGSSGMARSGGLAQMLRASGGAGAGGVGGAGNSMMQYGLLSGAMGDSMREMMMCNMMGLPRLLCMTRMMA